MLQRSQRRLTITTFPGTRRAFVALALGALVTACGGATQQTSGSLSTATPATTAPSVTTPRTASVSPSTAATPTRAASASSSPAPSAAPSARPASPTIAAAAGLVFPRAKFAVLPASDEY